MRGPLICGCVLMLAAGLFGCGSSGSDTSTTSSGGRTVTVPGGATFTRPAQSSSTTPTGTATVPANASFAARADAVCARYQTQRQAIFGQLAGQFRGSGGNGRRSGGNGPGPNGNGDIAQKAADAYRQAAESGRRELAELRGLPAPASQASAINDYFSSVETTLGDIDRLAAALGSSPRGALRSVGPQIRADGLKSRRLAEGLGLRVCGELR